MSRKINIEVLNLLGAKTFVNVMAVGASAFPSAVSETINLAYNTLGLEEEDAPIPPAALDLTAHVTKTVLKCISDQLGVRLADIKPTHGLVRNLGADSLDLIELTMYIEDELHIEISDELAERVVTVQNVIDTAIQLRREQGPTGN